MTTSFPLGSSKIVDLFLRVRHTLFCTDARKIETGQRAGDVDPKLHIGIGLLSALAFMEEALIKQELEHGTKSQASTFTVKQTFHLVFNCKNS